MRKIKDREKQQIIARRKHKRELRAKHSHDNRLLKYHRLREKVTKSISYTSMDAPTNFSILGNRDSVIKYFNTIKRMLNPKRIYTDEPAQDSLYRPSYAMLAGRIYAR